MYYTYKEAKKKFGSDYQIKEAMNKDEIYKIEDGLYSDHNYTDEYAIIFKRMKRAVLTLQSAFYYHGLTDYIPESIYVATPKSAYPVSIDGVKQVFMINKYFEIGIKTEEKEGYLLNVYDFERTLIELIRYEKKIPFEEYNHVIKQFRKRSDEIDFRKLMTYARIFKSKNKIINEVQKSVM